MTKKSTKYMITAFSAGFSALIVAVFIFTVWKGHADANEYARQRVQELTRTLEEHIIRIFRSADHTLDNIATQIILGTPQGSGENLKILLNHHVFDSLKVEHIIVIDPQGRRVAASSPIMIVDQDRSSGDVSSTNGPSKLNIRLVRDAEGGALVYRRKPTDD